MRCTRADEGTLPAADHAEPQPALRGPALACELSLDHASALPSVQAASLVQAPLFRPDLSTASMNRMPGQPVPHRRQQRRAGSGSRPSILAQISSAASP